MLVSSQPIAAAAFACALFAAPQAISASPGGSQTPPARAAGVEREGKAVMPFDLGRTMHAFEPLPDGGMQTVMVMDGDPKQVLLIRSHLKREAAAFRRGDFSDPARIHGSSMPGLAELREGAKRISVAYSDVSGGARIRYASRDPRLVGAIHRWFAAQTKDHARHSTMQH